MTIKDAALSALADAGITIDDLGTIETHDCFSIAGVLAYGSHLVLQKKAKARNLLLTEIPPEREDPDEHHRGSDRLGTSYRGYRCSHGRHPMGTTYRESRSSTDTDQSRKALRACPSIWVATM